MAALPQCDAYGLIYDPDGSPDVDKLVIILKVVDAAGNPISFEQRQTFTDQTGTFHFTLPRNATVTLTARASGIFADDTPVTFVVPDAPTGQLILSFPPDSLTVTPPLTWSANTLGILKATSTQDGYLSATDYVRFDAATNGGPKVTMFNTRTGDVLPQVNDYQSFYLSLGGGTLTGPLTLAADPTTALGAATRQYVDSKFAEGVSGVATFNGRTGAVLPIVGDYSSFYAPTIHTHPVFSASTNGMAPASGATTATKFLRDDGTWQLPSGGSAARPGEYYVAAYGASGSKNKYSGSISNGSTALTTTTATDFAVGQGIYIAGAKTGGLALVTTVTAISGTSITLQDAATAGVTAVANNIQHDDTDAIQAAIDAVFAAQAGTICFDLHGYYRVNKGFHTDVDTILKIPWAKWSDSTAPNKAGPAPPTIIFRGNNIYVPSITGPVSDAGPVIQTDLIGATATSSILSAGNYDAALSFDACNYITLAVEGLTFRTYDNPQVCGIEFGMVWNCYFRDVCIDTGVSTQGNDMFGGSLPGISQPTKTTTFGLRLPRLNATTVCNTNNLSVAGYYIGVIGSELWQSIYTYINRCMVGVQGHDIYANYPISGNFLIGQCPTSMYFPLHVPLDIHLELEGDDAGWAVATPGRDIYDPTNAVTGWVKYLVIRSGVPSGSFPLSFTGCQKLTIISLNHHGNQYVDFSLMDPAGLVQPVTMGSNDSAGAGYRELRAPNGTADTTAPNISGIASSGISGGGATITWTTDEPADSQVEYGTTTAYGSSTTLNTSLVTSHSQSITGLTASTLYHYRVKSKDAAANLATSADGTFTTGALDTTPPNITAVASGSLTATGATITWTTDEASDSQVEYGTTTAYGSSTTLNTMPVTSHSRSITGLTASTLYHYRVKSKDASGNMATSSDFTFTTLAAGGTLNTGLVSYWDLNESSSSATRIDHKANNPLTPYNNPAVVVGKLGNAAAAGGVAALNCPDNSTQNFGSGGLSVAGWIKILSLPASQLFGLISKWGQPLTPSDINFGLYFQSYSNAWAFTVSNDGTGATRVDATVSHTPTLGVWYFVIGVYDPSASQIRCYVYDSSGAQIGTTGTAAFSGAVFHSTHQLDVLAVGNATISDVVVDEVGLWNRALTTTEIAQLVNGGAGVTWPLP